MTNAILIFGGVAAVVSAIGKVMEGSLLMAMVYLAMAFFVAAIAWNSQVK
jgi:NADH:ubiquinone oxidoreductase subunit 6 (subunit J)